MPNWAETSFVFTTKLPDTCPSRGQNIIKHLNYDYSETSKVQPHRDLHSSFAGLPTGLASRGLTVTDSLVVNTKDVWFIGWFHLNPHCYKNTEQLLLDLFSVNNSMTFVYFHWRSISIGGRWAHLYLFEPIKDENQTISCSLHSNNPQSSITVNCRNICGQCYWINVVYQS